MASIHDLKPKPGSVHKSKRLGTGQGSGHGQTSTRGQKGQRSTSGGPKRNGFQGGQTPLMRRIPKSGFSNVQFRTEYEWVNVSSLEKYFKAGVEITPAELVKRRLVKCGCLVKILGDGEVTKALNVSAHSFSKGAADKIAKAGGKTTVLSCEKPAEVPAAPAKPAAKPAAKKAAVKKTKTDKK